VLDAALSNPQELSGALNEALPALRRTRQKGASSNTATTVQQEYQTAADALAQWLAREAVSSPQGGILRTACTRSMQHVRGGEPARSNEADAWEELTCAEAGHSGGATDDGRQAPVGLLGT
jgi:phage/plasmid-associated DNA primase